MTRTRSLTRGAATAALILAASVARGQAAPVAASAAPPKPDGFSMFSLSLAQLSASGSASTGGGVSYGQVVNAFLWGVDGAYYSQSGISSESALVYGGFGTGPYRNPAVPSESNNKSVAFGVVGGLFSSFSTNASDSNPFAGGAMMAPLGAGVMTKIVGGYVFHSGGNTLYVNIGLGMRF